MGRQKCCKRVTAHHCKKEKPSRSDTGPRCSMLTAGPPAQMPPERPPPPPPRGGRARTVMASDAAQRPLGPRVLSATTTTAQQATRPHPAAAGAGLSLAPAPIAYGTGVLGSTVSAAHAIAQHQLVADAAQAAATNQARHPSRTLPVQTARGRLEGGPAGSAPPRRTHVRGGASAPAAVARACRAAVPFGRAQRRGGLLGMAASAHGL